MFRYRYLIVLLSALIISSCDSILDGRKGDQYGENRNLWQEQKIDSYRFEYTKLCYCAGLFNPATIVVKADTIHAILEPETGEPLRDAQTDELVLAKYPESFRTISELFDIIKDAREKADKLKVEYNQQLGYPTLIDIDYIKEAVDDEVTYKIDNFEAKE
ncbi:MAG: DUF6174 domain-containing protein [Balneolaceae bacterium]|nr:DUF6174 domain-containing protein [Balneolaceae bacterium]